MRSDKEIVDQTNDLARKFYSVLGYNSKKNFKFQNAIHPQEIAMWQMACIAQEVLTNTDVENCIEELENKNCKIRSRWRKND